MGSAREALLFDDVQLQVLFQLGERAAARADRDRDRRQLVFVDEAQAGVVIGAYQAAGMDCYEESGGTRCVGEWEGVAGSAGESHFLREGLWIATRWDGPAVSGYTADIIAQLFA